MIKRPDIMDAVGDPCEQHGHNWGEWKVVAYTGDWFHPRVIERKCKVCGETEQDEP